MKFLTALFILFFFQSLMAASEQCIQLEGLNIGCVTAESHTCFLNKHPRAEGAREGECKYVNPNALPPIKRQIENPKGAIAFDCASYENKTTCVRQGDKTVCQTSSVCKEYTKPSCTNHCILCYTEVKSEQAFPEGCVVCTRPRCNDEPPLNGVCPVDHPTDKNFILPKIKYPVCANDRPCPQTAIDPNGVEHQVTIIDLGCPPIPDKVEKAEEGGGVQRCPWIKDERGTDKNNQPVCNPISVGNRFPQDCCACSSADPQNCKACANQTKEQLGCQ